MPHSIRPGDVLADRYTLVDLLSEAAGGRFFRAEDQVLDRHVALHVLGEDDERAPGLMEAARVSATVSDRRILRVLDADQRDGLSYVVNEWGEGTSLDHLVGGEGPLTPRRAAWLAAEVADTLRTAHDARVSHGRLVPENVLIDQAGQVRLIGFCVDAALNGLPAGDLSEDVDNLGGLLYFLLTGRWPGPGTSACPEAPTAHDRVLRARQVRAGIPRVLDALCDQVINPYAATPMDTPHNLQTAEGIHDLLRDFVGDATGLAQPAMAGALAVPAPPSASQPSTALATAPETSPTPVPPEPDPGDRGREPDPAPDVEPDAEPEAEPEARSEPTPAPGPLPPPAVGGAEVTAMVSPVDTPTQLGMPIFDDEGDEVTWLTARTEPPPPPPPLVEPPERPLFAADPARKVRPGSKPANRADYWPWADATSGSATGSGVIPVTEDDDDGEVPGRSWLQLAALLSAGLLLLVAIVIAYNLGRGKTPLGADPDPTTSTSSTPTAEPRTPIKNVTADDLDPQASPPEENPDLAPLAVDGNPDTVWPTSTYSNQLGPAGLKTGVGLVLDLHGSHEVTGINLTLVGAPTSVSIYASDTRPRFVAPLDPVDEFEASGRVDRRTFDEPVPARYVVVWLTSLPSVDDGYRGEVAEAVVTE